VKKDGERARREDQPLWRVEGGRWVLKWARREAFWDGEVMVVVVDLRFQLVFSVGECQQT